MDERRVSGIVMAVVVILLAFGIGWVLQQSGKSESANANSWKGTPIYSAKVISDASDGEAILVHGRIASTLMETPDNGQWGFYRYQTYSDDSWTTHSSVYPEILIRDEHGQTTIYELGNEDAIYGDQEIHEWGWGSKRIIGGRSGSPITVYGHAESGKIRAEIVCVNLGPNGCLDQVSGYGDQMVAWGWLVIIVGMGFAGYIVIKTY